MRKVLLVFVSMLICSCASYTGDKLLSLTSIPVKPTDGKALESTRESIKELYNKLELPIERQVSIDSLNSYFLIQDNGNVEFAHESKRVFLINGNIKISRCQNSIIIATGDVEIAHGSNNIIISEQNVEISHDRGGSIVIAKGKVNISFATNTTVYSSGGLTISHPNNVISYNTEDRKTSWGHVNNILIDPLFKPDEDKQSE